MFHELLSRGREDGLATGQPQGVGPEAYLNGTSQGTIPEDAQKDGYIRGRSKQLMNHPGYRARMLIKESRPSITAESNELPPRKLDGNSPLD